MKKYLTFTAALVLCISFFSSSCSKNEPDVPEPSPRDGVYEGENLTVTMNGEPVSSIKSVVIKSRKMPYSQSLIVGGNDLMGETNRDVYNTSVIFTGFPGTDEEINLETVSSIYYFDGKFSINMPAGIQYYEFSGTFTGDPHLPHSEQGLILDFTSIEIP